MQKRLKDSFCKVFDQFFILLKFFFADTAFSFEEVNKLSADGIHSSLIIRCIFLSIKKELLSFFKFFTELNLVQISLKVRFNEFFKNANYSRDLIIYVCGARSRCFLASPRWGLIELG